MINWNLKLRHYCILAIFSFAYSHPSHGQFREAELRSLLDQLDLRVSEQLIVSQSPQLSAAFRDQFRTRSELNKIRINAYFSQYPQEIMAFREYAQRLADTQVITVSTAESLVLESLRALQDASIYGVITPDRQATPRVIQSQRRIDVFSLPQSSGIYRSTQSDTSHTDETNDQLDFGESLQRDQEASIAAQKLQDEVEAKARAERNKKLAQALINEFSNGTPSAGSVGKRVEQVVQQFVESESEKQSEALVDNVEISVESITGGPEYSIRALKAFDKVNQNYFSFSEFGLTADGDDTTVNVGVGIRKLSDSEKLMGGINLYYDQEIGSGHKRGSVGVELISSPLRFHANRYFSLSDGTKLNTPQAEKPLSGHDYDVELALPYFPGLFAGYNQSTWYGVSGADDVERKAYRLTGNLSPNLTLELSNRTFDTGIEDQNTAKLSYNYRFGSEDNVPTLIDMDTKAYRLETLSPHEKHAFVNRENKIITQVASTSNLQITFTGL